MYQGTSQRAGNIRYIPGKRGGVNNLVPILFIRPRLFRPPSGLMGSSRGSTGNLARVYLELPQSYKITPHPQLALLHSSGPYPSSPSDSPTSISRFSFCYFPLVAFSIQGSTLALRLCSRLTYNLYPHSIPPSLRHPKILILTWCASPLCPQGVHRTGCPS